MRHGGITNNVRVNIQWLDSELIEKGEERSLLLASDGILVPGGFGERGTKGKIEAVKVARENKIPYFGICFGMQMAVIETARNILGLKDAGSTEFGNCGQPVVGLLEEWLKGNSLEKRTIHTDKGGSMRLGAYECYLKTGSKIYDIYKLDKISERHRHRYEVNITYREKLEKQAGLIFSGMSKDNILPEIIERADHPWFIGVQFHPELKSKPFEPHPLFVSFIHAALQQSRLV